jgi:hypothetical protein
MRWWYGFLTIVLTGAAIALYLMVRFNVPISIIEMWSRDSQAKNTHVRTVSKVPPVPEELLELRQRHQLRPLTEREDGKPAQELPRGIYGFSPCSVISLRAMRDNTSLLEIHRHHNGIVFYVGYASDEDINKYLVRQKNFHILTSALPGERTSSLFEIPIDFVSKCEMRSARDGYLFDLFVTTIPEFQS